MSYEQQRAREDVQRDLDRIRRMIQQSKDANEQQRLKKQLQEMQARMPANTYTDWQY